MRIRIQNPKNVHMDSDVRMVNIKKEKLHQKIFNYIFQNYIKKSLQINKLSINLSITKGSLLLFFQFYIYLMNLHISEAFLPPGSGSETQTVSPLFTSISFSANTEFDENTSGNFDGVCPTKISLIQ